jgi:hypothetical protein
VHAALVGENSRQEITWKTKAQMGRIILKFIVWDVDCIDLVRDRDGWLSV